MMGRQTGDQSQLFYVFNLEERIPDRHLLRRVNPIVTGVLDELREKLRPFYSEIGRPSIDPEPCCECLSSATATASASSGSCARRSSFTWLIVGSAASILKTRCLITRPSRSIVTAASATATFFGSCSRRWSGHAWMRGWSRAKDAAVDASVMEADASRYHGKAPDEIDWSAPERQTRAVSEFLSGLDDEDPNADRKLPKVISPTDPCSAWTAKANKRVQFGYGLNYLIDIENAVIVDVEATPARTYDEVAATKTMIERTEQRFDVKPDRLAADTAYGTGKFLGWLVDAGITPHIPVWDKGNRYDGTFSRSDFTFDKEKNEYRCPNGKALRTTGRVHDGRTILYRASKFDCGPCPLKSKCCPNVPERKVPRDVHEEARDHARAHGHAGVREIPR